MPLPEHKYIRDKAGNAWIIKTKISGTNIVDIFCDTDKNSRTKTEYPIHHLDAKLNVSNQSCKIYNIHTHKDYLRLHIGAWMMMRLIFLCKEYGIIKITGELSPVDAGSDEDLRRRDGFWRSLSAEITHSTEDKKTGKFSFNLRKYSPVPINAYEIQEKEFDTQLELHELKTKYNDCLMHVHGLKKSLELECGKPLWLEIAGIVLRIVSPIVFIILYPFYLLKKHFTCSNNDSKES